VCGALQSGRIGCRILPVSESLSPEAVKVLVDSHDQFLRFLQSRVGSREVAEDILQAAFVKTFERGEEIRDPESAVAWFYRVLRNAIVDDHRHKAVDLRFKAAASKEAPPAEDPELEKAVCQCVKDILPTLRGEYADILQKVEMEGTAVTDIAKVENITPNNAMVRLHRARKALHGRLVQTCGTCTEHGCLECHCKG
jgi:RNA polymerase sigma factor (sigma-70 family)